jgi:hypothetical protein
MILWRSGPGGICEKKEDKSHQHQSSTAAKGSIPHPSPSSSLYLPAALPALILIASSFAVKKIRISAKRGLFLALEAGHGCRQQQWEWDCFCVSERSGAMEEDDLSSPALMQRNGWREGWKRGEEDLRMPFALDGFDGRAWMLVGWFSCARPRPTFWLAAVGAQQPIIGLCFCRLPERQSILPRLDLCRMPQRIIVNFLWSAAATRRWCLCRWLEERVKRKFK